MGGRRGVRGTREGGLSRCDINMVWILVFTAGLIWRELGFRSVMFCYFGVTQHMMWEEKSSYFLHSFELATECAYGLKDTRQCRACD